jgi:hypothetical protein
LGERRYSSYSFSTSALDEGEWSASRPGRALAPEKGPPVPIVQGLGGPQSGSGDEDTGKNPFASAGDRNTTVKAPLNIHLLISPSELPGEVVGNSDSYSGSATFVSQS